MGMGRREFLKNIGAAMLGLEIDPLLATVTADDAYINKKLGILFRKPSEWGFVRVRDFGRLKDMQILGNGWNDFKEELWEDLGDPICIATRFPQDSIQNRGVFSPTVTLNITPKDDLADLGATGFEEVVRLSELGTAMILERFCVLERFAPFELSGCRFHEYRSEYLFHHEDLAAPILAELRTLKTEHRGFYYDFNWHECAAQHQTAEREYREFKKSIRLI